MHLDKNKFSMAAASVLGIWYIICATLVALVPNVAERLFSWMAHLVNLEPGIGFPEAIYGFIEILILTYVTAYIFALLHNRFVKPGQ